VETIVTRALSYDEYRQLVEKSPILIWRAALDMGCDYFNEHWLAFTGRTMEQEVGNGWAQGVHPDDFDRCLKIYVENFAQKTTFEMEYRLLRFDGVYRWIFDRGTPYTDADGTFLGFIGSCVDVTERIEAQQALAKTQEAEVRTLRGFLPMCAYCKKIRNDKNYWEQLESYVSSHTDAMISHGVCPDCSAHVMSELNHRR
jgi:PAS domain S-box-containing protein